jgi:hypothetical protein
LLTLDNYGNSMLLEGNGYSVTDQIHISLGIAYPFPYVLTPGPVYSLQMQLLLTPLDPPTAGDPTSRAVVEFGRLSAYDGFGFSMQTRVVPEPAYLLSAVCLTLLIMSRSLVLRRRQRHAG